MLSRCVPCGPGSVSETVEEFTDKRVVGAASHGGHADFTDLDRLRDLVTGGDLVLVKGSYLMKLAAAGQILARRQDLPDDAVCDAQMLDRALEELNALKGVLWHAILEAHFPGIVVVSYAWATRDHPDPK